jgi:hypothetical protein
MEALFSPAAAAKFLTINIKTMEAMRLRGNGPKWVRVSSRRIAYRPADLRTWVDNRLYSSTSEYGRAE